MTPTEHPTPCLRCDQKPAALYTARITAPAGRPAERASITLAAFVGGACEGGGVAGA